MQVFSLSLILVYFAYCLFIFNIWFFLLNRVNCCGDRFRNARVFVSNTPAKKGIMGSDADLCGKYTGPSENGAVETITCSNPGTGR
jgi:hypothetical protein